jgi:hypothetical protein
MQLRASPPRVNFDQAPTKIIQFNEKTACRLFKSKRRAFQDNPS